jgi:Xaa-Pro dipeptidase
MRPIKIGAVRDEERSLTDRLVAIQDRALAEVAAGVAAAVPDRLYRDGLRSAGLVDSYPNKTFYSVGLLLPPSGGESLEATPSCTWSFESGMTFHTYLLVRGFGFSETILLTELGCERLTHFERRLLVGGTAGAK